MGIKRAGLHCNSAHFGLFIAFLVSLGASYRIAAGAGVKVEQINQLLKQFDMMNQMVKQFSGPGASKKMKRMGKMGGMGGFSGGFPGM